MRSQQKKLAWFYTFVGQRLVRAICALERSDIRYLLHTLLIAAHSWKYLVPLTPQVRTAGGISESDKTQIF